MKILITRHLPDEVLAPIASHDVVVHPEPTQMPHDRFMDEIATAHVVFSFLTDRLDIETIDHAPHLRAISQMAAGTDNIDLEACTARGIAVGHTPGVLTEATADTAFALLAAAVRRLPEGQEHARSGEWSEWRHDLLLGGDLYGTTIGIVGMGAIGSAIARRASGFAMRILYTARHRRPHLEASLRVSHRELADLLAASDHVVLAVPLTQETHHLIGRSELAAMQQHAVLVNVARGPVVDTTALVEALSAGSIGAAALDVTDPEPLPADHPLLRLANCLVVPHLGSATRSARHRMMSLAVDNMIAATESRPMIRCANPAVYGSAEVGLDHKQHAAGE